MPIKFDCADCHKKLSVADEVAGKRVKCPACGTVQSVPVAAAVGSQTTPVAAGAMPTAPVPGGDAAQAATLPPSGRAGANQDTATLPPAPVRPVAAGEARSVPGYEVIKELGRGGMGVVYKARQTALQRTVALKMILAGAHAGPEELARFRAEARAAARMQHPNIVQIYEIGTQDDLPYFSLEFVAGGSLAAWLDDEPWSSRDAAALLEPLALAMDYAHERGIVHRDLKPANILLAPCGERRSATSSSIDGRSYEPKIADFGLAKRLEGGKTLTRTGAMLGTPGYMASEQASGKVRGIGPAADVYALGAILYELLTCRPPFQAASQLDTVLQLLSEEPVPPRERNHAIDVDLDTICLKCLSRDPQDRYASAADLAEDLRCFLDGKPLKHARPATEWRAAIRWTQNHWITAATTVFVVGVLVLLYALGIVLSFNNTTPDFFLPLVLGAPAFLATLAILVRTRRWVVFGSLLFVLLAVGGPCVSWMIWGWSPGGTMRARPQLVSIALFLAAGAVPAGLFGGISRLLAYRYKVQFLSIFFGGTLTAAPTMFCCNCCSGGLYVLGGGGRPGVVTQPGQFALQLVAVFLGALVGFGLGATAVIQVSRRWLKPG